MKVIITEEQLKLLAEIGELGSGDVVQKCPGQSVIAATANVSNVDGTDEWGDPTQSTADDIADKLTRNGYFNGFYGKRI